MPPLLPSQARTLLVWGERLVADGRHEDARRRLREAAVLFEQVGARSWLKRIDGALATMADDPAPADDAVLRSSEAAHPDGEDESRSEEHTSELQSLMRISYAVFCLKKKNTHKLTRQIKNNKYQ